MLKELIGGIKGTLNYIPILIILGIIMGQGAYSTLLGALIASVIFFILCVRYPFVFAPSITFVLVVSALNMVLGGEASTLYSLLFISGLFAILFSLISLLTKKKFAPPKAVSKGFVLGILISFTILCIPLILGQTTFSSVTLMQYSGKDIFFDVKEQGIVISFIVFASYYYLSKFKSALFPNAFLSLIIGSIVSHIYKFNLPYISSGFTGYKPIPTADFGNIWYLIILSFVSGLVLYLQTNFNMNYSKESRKDANKIVLLSGVSTSVASVFGGIGGGIAPAAIKNNFTKNKTSVITLVSTLIFFVFVLFFEQISSYIPAACAASIAFVICLQYIIKIFKDEKTKNVNSRIIFAICCLSCLYNVILGTMIAAIISLLSRKNSNG